MISQRRLSFSFPEEMDNLIDFPVHVFERDLNSLETSSTFTFPKKMLNLLRRYFKINKILKYGPVNILNFIVNLPYEQIWPSCQSCSRNILNHLSVSCFSQCQKITLLRKALCTPIYWFEGHVDNNNIIFLRRCHS